MECNVEARGLSCFKTAGHGDVHVTEDGQAWIAEPGSDGERGGPVQAWTGVRLLADEALKPKRRPAKK